MCVCVCVYGATRVKVKFESGESVEADLVIGADGINSRVASYILGTQPSIASPHLSRSTLSWIIHMVLGAIALANSLGNRISSPFNRLTTRLRPPSPLTPPSLSPSPFHLPPLSCCSLPVVQARRWTSPSTLATASSSA